MYIILLQITGKYLTITTQIDVIVKQNTTVFRKPRNIWMKKVNI